MPVYNSEKFIRNALDSLLSQTFRDFELIISDNASTDSTSAICLEYAGRDTRIRYIYQNKNMGGKWNFNFVLQEASCKYFMWAAVDDYWFPTFIEKNIKVLESNNKIVCSTSQVKPYGEKTNYLTKNDADNFTEKFKKTVIRKFTPLRNYPTYGSYEKKIRYYLKLRGHQQVFYGVFRTEQLRKFFAHDITTTGVDLATMLIALKFGDYNVLEEVLTYRYDGGVSSGGLFNYARANKLNFFGIIFVHYPFIRWCWKNLGAKIFFKNIDCFIKINLELFLYLLVDIVRKLKGK